jgi:phage terminase large subunit-like protein
LSAAVLEQLLVDMPARDAQELEKRFRYDWTLWARSKQLEPSGDWDILGLVAGKGGGKTRPGAEMVRARAEKYPGIRIALVGRTAADVRDVMVQGESGVLAVSPPWCRPVYKPSLRVVQWPNGSQATMYSADKPDQLRGPQHQFAWGDEFAAWPKAAAWTNLQDGMRLRAIPGLPPQTVLTTTPRRTLLVADTFLGPLEDYTASDGRRMSRRAVTVEQSKGQGWEFTAVLTDRVTGELVRVRTVVRRWSTEENARNLSAGFAAKRRAKYGSTSLGRQELDGEIADKVEGALWQQDVIDNSRVSKAPALKRIEVALDPTRSNDPTDECGIVVGGVADNGECYVLDDMTVKGSPHVWVQAALGAYNKYSAHAIVYEGNRLGEDIRNTIRTSAPGTKWVEVTASSDKATRAAGPSALYEQGKVHHVLEEHYAKRGENPLAILEEEMCVWDPLDSKASPNRLDALVWLVTSLMIGVRPVLVAPRITGTRPSGWRTQG